MKFPAATDALASWRTRICCSYAATAATEAILNSFFTKKRGQPAMILRHLFPSPIGLLSMTEENGFITELSLREAADIPGSFHSRCPSADPGLETELFRQAKKQLEQYFAGQRRAFELPIRCQGTAFQLRVWKRPVRDPYGPGRAAIRTLPAPSKAPKPSAPSVRQTTAIRSSSLCPATGSSIKTATLAAMPAAIRSKNSCWNWNRVGNDQAISF